MMEQSLRIGKVESLHTLGEWLEGKSYVALVTDGVAYSLCGAETVFDNFLGKIGRLKVKHLVVPSANPKVETVQPLLDEIGGEVDGFVAVGGGTTIDTTKLLNLACASGKDIKSILTSKTAPDVLKPCFAFPTTAGTGAEATRFAVCYDGDVKYSIDFEVIRPSEVGLVGDFIATLPSYQKASTNFDAYSQAVESLWAKGATSESKEYAQRALSLMRRIENDSISGQNFELQLQASYWAGRAIDISRTTAAHAFSYYLTSHYGIPHGHAVYMVFEYICRNNQHPEYIKRVPALKTLREFAAEKGIGWDDLVDDLFSHVNLKRLGNNPVEVRRESFNG